VGVDHAPTLPPGAGETFDSLAWLDGTDAPTQIERLEVDGTTHAATARTLPRLAELKELSHVD
jgi:hypothetical protein